MSTHIKFFGTPPLVHISLWGLVYDIEILKKDCPGAVGYVSISLRPEHGCVPGTMLTFPWLFLEAPDDLAGWVLFLCSYYDKLRPREVKQLMEVSRWKKAEMRPASLAQGLAVRTATPRANYKL